MEKVFTRSDGAYLGKAQEIMPRVFNHATYYRGQLITMGRQVGLQNPPRADYIYHIAEKNRQQRSHAPFSNTPAPRFSWKKGHGERE